MLQKLNKISLLFREIDSGDSCIWLPWSHLGSIYSYRETNDITETPCKENSSQM